MDNKTDNAPSAPIKNNPDNGIQAPPASNSLNQNQVKVPSTTEYQKLSENQNDSSTQNKKENAKEIEPVMPKKIRKRTTKKESDIRNYKCTYCEKSYLSYPALYTHCKQKHNTNNHSGRGRGRPKKEQLGENIEKNKFDPLTSDYFLKEDRSGSTKIESIKECARNAFKYLYDNEENKESLKQKIEARKMKFFTKIEDHPFLGKFINDKHDINSNNDDEKTPIDLVFIDYLNKMSIYCNEKFYEKLIIFVILFREHINLINQDKTEKDKEFTQDHEAEDVPESSNEFITDFLYPEEQDYEFGLSKNESIDLTRNLCNWMYLNNFTCSKLFLLDK
jgi:hypothetical protein